MGFGHLSAYFEGGTRFCFIITRSYPAIPLVLAAVWAVELVGKSMISAVIMQTKTAGLKGRLVRLKLKIDADKEEVPCIFISVRIGGVKPAIVKV